MKPTWTTNRVKVWCGDALEVLRAMPSDTVQCVITSPPYFGLGDYGTGTWEGGEEGQRDVADRTQL